MYSIRGAYVPLTKEGNIIVDGILASSYPVHHDLTHIVMTPFLWFPEIIQWIFGENNGSPTYVNIFEILGMWVVPYGQQLNVKINFQGTGY